VQPATLLDPSTSSIYMDSNSQHRYVPAIKSSSLVTTKDMIKTGAWSAMPLLAVSLSEIPAVGRLLSTMLGTDVVAPHKIIKHLFVRTATALRGRQAAAVDDIGLSPATMPHPSSNDPACKQGRHRWLVGSVAVIVFLMGLAGRARTRSSRQRAMAAHAANVAGKNTKPQQAPSPLHLDHVSPTIDKHVQFHRMMTVEGPSRQVTAAGRADDMEKEMDLAADFYRISTEQAPPSPRLLVGK